MDRSQIERATVGQSDNCLWHTVRQGRITGSNVGTIVKRRNITPDFVKRQKTRKDLSRIPAIAWGVSKEDIAKQNYVALTGNSVHECGIFISSKCKWLGATPDGIVRDCTGQGLLEIKCPYSIRTEHPIHCFKKLTFTDKEGNLKKNHNYYYQIQTQLYTSEYTWCDFVIWTPIGLHIQRIESDDVFLNSHVLPKLNHFYTNHWQHG